MDEFFSALQLGETESRSIYCCNVIWIDVKRFIERGVDVNTKNRLGYYPLHIVAINGGTELLEYLLSLGSFRYAENF
jgi:ankyrin repeat protein